MRDGLWKSLSEEGFGGVKDKIAAVRPAIFPLSPGQMVNFLGTMQMEFAGAQAFNSVDTYLGSFRAL